MTSLLIFFFFCFTTKGKNTATKGKMIMLYPDCYTSDSDIVRFGSCFLFFFLIKKLTTDIKQDRCRFIKFQYNQSDLSSNIFNKFHQNPTNSNRDTCISCKHGTHKQTDRQTDKHTHTHTDRQTDRQTDSHTNRQTDRQTNKQTYRQTDRQTNRLTHIQTDRQTDKQTHTHTDR